jgi:hypothetical protein
VAADRLLIVAGATASSPEDLPERVRMLIEGASEVLVVSPVLTSRLHLWTNDTDRVREEADERLGILLGGVGAISPATNVQGVVGDEVPLTAFDDAVRVFAPDHILIALRGGTDAAWQEHGLPERVRETFGLPVTVIEIDEHGRVARGNQEGSTAPEDLRARHVDPSS